MVMKFYPFSSLQGSVHPQMHRSRLMLHIDFYRSFQKLFCMLPPQFLICKTISCNQMCKRVSKQTELMIHKWFT
ncbi:hypothetical protein HanXRQr2_Chr15g0715711 [Helianthus annuus]|uniref:Uncharacterized protein n=1 Tax=Helianthus annuus TaxID=4232 RepID=A0A251SCJ2_HELAN|nr:hypothetical protein HanXRQr2_Chr15g0715711 [Helianthus annuus]KAJ0833133.1 hypothetical protein HanPSC8_Chr15g0686781 [Helianthus annuus]